MSAEVAPLSHSISQRTLETSSFRFFRLSTTKYRVEERYYSHDIGGEYYEYVYVPSRVSVTRTRAEYPLRIHTTRLPTHTPAPTTLTKPVYCGERLLSRRRSSLALLAAFLPVISRSLAYSAPVSHTPPSPARESVSPHGKVRSGHPRVQLRPWLPPLHTPTNQNQTVFPLWTARAWTYSYDSLKTVYFQLYM